MSEPARIKLRDKQQDGEEPKKYHRKNHCANIHFAGYYRMLHDDRVEYHRQRVQYEMCFMRRHGIRPYESGSAYSFDKLIGEIK